jgi:hypothetical protein
LTDLAIIARDFATMRTLAVIFVLALIALKGAFGGITMNVIRLLDHLSVQWTTNTDALKNGSREFNLKVHFETPPQLDTVLEELKRIG